MSVFDIRTRLISEVVAARTEALTAPVTVTWTHLARLAADADLGPRRSFELRRLASFAECYLQLFCPAPDATLRQATADGALVWTTEGCSFGDLLVTSSPKAAVLSPEARTAANRLFDGGMDAVRVLKLTAPLTSLLLTSPKAPPVSLVDTELWFSQPPIRPADVVAAASGGDS